MRASHNIVLKGAQMGLTLIEVVIALLILVVAVLAVSGLQASSLRATRTSQIVQDLNGTARAELEAWRASSISYTSIANPSCALEPGEGCSVEVRPCAFSSNELDCGAGTVTHPVAHAVTVTVERDDASVTLGTLVMNR